MDRGSFIVYINPKDICVDIAKDVETRYELERPLPLMKKLMGLH